MHPIIYSYIINEAAGPIENVSHTCVGYCLRWVQGLNWGLIGVSGVKLYTNMAFGTAKSVLFIEMSSFQGVLIIEGFHCIYSAPLIECS